MVIKKVILGFAIVLTLFVGINTVAALSSSVLDAISGLPLGDQVLFIAREVECLKADSFMQKALNVSGIIDADTATDLNARRQQMIDNGVSWRLTDFDPLYNQYQAAKSACLGE